MTRKKPRLPSPVNMRVVGVTFCSRYPGIAYRIADRIQHRTVKAALVREPHNPYDPNAVAVHVGKVKLGHIDRAMAKRLAPELDDGTRWTATFAEVTVHPDNPNNPGIWLAMTRQT